MSGLDRFARHIAHLRTSDLLRTLIWMSTGNSGPNGAVAPALVDNVKIFGSEETVQAFEVLCREIDMRFAAGVPRRPVE